jgi:hypothetical protein
VTIVFALLTALSNALNVTTQHKASISGPRTSRGWGLVLYLFKSPLWLFGWIALAAAFLFQALALHTGEISVVQPLLVTELVFVLFLRRFWIRQSIRSVTWWSAAMTCASLAVFIGMSEPHGGNAFPSSHAWVGASAVTIGVVVLLSSLAMVGSPTKKACLFASATAILWALVATFIKTTAYTDSEYGAGGMFLHWPVYALAVSGLVAEVLNQVTLHVGPLSVSQPFLVIVDPIASIILGVWIFDEYFTPSVPRLAVGALAFAIMCFAVILLIRSSPRTMDPTEVSSATGG